MDWEAELIDRARTGAVGAYEGLSTPTLLDAARRGHGLPRDRCAAEDCVQEAATPGWQRVQNLKPEHLLPPVVPRHCAENVEDSAVLSPGEVSTESMVDEREADLIQRALLGDAGAYDGILTPHLPIAWRLAYSLIRDRSGAEDCVQEAAKRGWLRLENLQPGMPFRPWFLGIVVRQCKEYRRSRWVTAVRLVDPEQLLRSNDDDWLERRLEGVELRRAFARLPRDQQVAVHLHLVEDLPQAEAAMTMGISLSNVKSKIDRAKKRLRTALEEG
jgi:RNA polymerase sigma-70 factor (ECF subfamily)